MRYYAAVLTGSLAQIASAAFMWIYTDMDIVSVLFWSVMFYFWGLIVFLAVTTPKPKKKKEKKKERRFQVYDLKGEHRNV